MARSDQPGRTGSAANDDWLQPRAEQEGLRRYVATLRERVLFITLTVVLTTGFAILYVLVVDSRFEAEAELFVSPVSSSDPALEGLPLIRGSSDPTRDVETAAGLVTTTEVASRVQEELDLSGDPNSLLGDVEAEPVAQSNLVAVTAEAGAPDQAQLLAFTFAEQAIQARTSQLHRAIRDKLPELEAQQETNDSSELSDQIVRLRTLLAGNDPTLLLEPRDVETLPTTQTVPRTRFSIAAGIFAGLVLGIVGAFAMQGLDPRLRREEQLRRLYRLPILARIPRDPEGRAQPISPRTASTPVLEAYRTLRGTVSAASHEHGTSRAILVTGSSPSEGKTTTAVNLASALAASGRRVILIEADLRRPTIGKLVGIKPHRGIVSVLIESAGLGDALIGGGEYGPNLRFLLADYEGGSISELFALPAALRLIDRARELADFVIVDSPPLTDVIDALPLTRHVDDVLIVARLGKTRLNKLAQLGELLAENGIRPLGFAVVGTPPPSRGESTYYLERKEMTLSSVGEPQEPGRD